jgi:deoxyribonuclease V
MQFNVHHEHPWNVSPREAVALQRRLAEMVRVAPLRQPVRTVAGVDVSVRGGRVQTAIVVVRLPELDVVDEAVWQGDVQYPYVPGLLSFREMPAILPALERLRVRPDVFMTDSQGLAHPRRLGLGCHLGVLLDWPTLGVAKSRLTGTYGPLGPEKGDAVPLLDRDEVIGMVLRTRQKVKPVYVSVGHRITLPEAVELTMACTTRYKIPEPTRLAHKLSKKRGIEK